MACVKTGATVYFADYGFVSPADLYSVGDTCVIRWNEMGKHFLSLEESHASHIVVLPITEQFHRDDLGITVVPWSAIKSV